MMKTLLILAPGFEEIEALTLLDVARRAKMDIQACALHNTKTVTGSHQIEVCADLDFSQALSMPWDVLALPGGMAGVNAMLAQPQLLALIKTHAADGKRIAAICAAPMILDQCGLLAGTAFTCHPTVADKIKTGTYIDAPTLQTQSILTGRSAGCAMAWSLAFVAWCLGEVPAQLRDGLAMP